MIEDLDATLRNLLAGELEKIPLCPVREPSQITFLPPSETDSLTGGDARVNLYLYDLRENLSVRDESFHRSPVRADQSIGIKRAPVRLDLSYLVTAQVEGDAGAEHRLLSDVLRVLLRYLALPPEYLYGSLEGAGPNAFPLSIAQPETPAGVSSSVLWQSLGGRIRPSVSLVISALFDPFETKWTKVVREAILSVGVSHPPGRAQPPLDRSSVRVSAVGVTVDRETDQPLKGVEVSLDGREETMLTDDQGIFFFLNLPPGPHRLRFKKQGFHDGEEPTVAPPPGRPEQLDPVVIALRKLPPDERVKIFPPG